MIEFILGAFLYAKLKKKYKIIKILNHWTSWLPLAFVLFYVILEIMIFNENYFFLTYSYWFKIATLMSYIPLCIYYKLYESDNPKYQYNELMKMMTSPMIIATLFLTLGSTFNRIAMYFNGGYMMTYPSNSYWTGYIKPQFIGDGLHMIGSPYSAIIPFCNQFDLGYTVLSIGDILIRLFVFIIIYKSIKYSNKTIK